MIENPISTVRMLKGAPASVLLALLFVRQPVGESWLVSVTGYSSIPIRRALTFMAEAGLVKRDGRYSAWSVSEGATQLPLMFDGLPDAVGEGGKPSSERALIINAPTPATATTTMEGSDGYGSSSRNRGLKINVPGLNPQPELIAMLRQAGIGEPMATRLAGMAHVNAKYLRAHIRQCQQDEIPTALLIHRIRMADPQPETEEERLNRRRLASYKAFGICPRCHVHPCHCDEDET
jgi:hypothetical protein